MASKGQFPSFLAPAFCSHSLTALKETDIRLIAMGEVIRRRVAKCIAKEAVFEEVESFRAKHLGVAVNGGAEGVVHVTKINFEKMVKTKSVGILQIALRNALNSVKRSHFFGSTKILMPIIMSFLHPFVFQSMVICCSIAQLLTVSQECNKEIRYPN